MFSVLVIVLNGVVGLALLLCGLRHGEQSHNLQGAVVYLAIIVPLSVIALVLPGFILSTSDGTLTKTQSLFFSLFTILLYGVFLAVQTIRNRHEAARKEHTLQICKIFLYKWVVVARIRENSSQPRLAIETAEEGYFAAGDTSVGSTPTWKVR